jgi:hypothetical protein
MISGIGILCINQEQIAVLTAMDKEPLGEIVSFEGYLCNFTFDKLYREVFEAKQIVDVEFTVGQHRYVSKGYISSLTIEKNSECPFCEFEIHELKGMR